MNYTITCPGCGNKLKLFDSQVKQKQGSIRCTRCGQKIKYDLTKPDPVSTGFWADTEVPFKVGAQKRFLSITKARQKQAENGTLSPLAALSAPSPESTGISRVPEAFDRTQNHFQKFDMKTGQIIGAASSPAASQHPAPVPTVPFQNVPKPAAQPAKPAKPLSPTMQKLEDLKRSLDDYKSTRNISHTEPSPAARSALSRKPANIPVSTQKAARLADSRRASASIARPLRLMSKSFPKLQPSSQFLSRLRTLFSSFFKK